MEPRPDTPLQSVLTPHEEQAWLLQQQYPEQVRKHFSAWSLGCAFDTQRLQAALRAVIDALPTLNARYLFDDEGELRKVTAEDWQACVGVLHVETEAQAGELLLARQALPWDAETQAPLSALVIQTGQGAILGFVLHEVLDQTCREDDLYRLVMDAYDGRPVGVPHLPWLVRHATDSKPITSSSSADAEDAMDAEAMGVLILAEFRAMLGEPGMTLEDDFFEFGGHSLLATRIIGKLADSHGVEVDYISASGKTISGSRNGHTPMIMWSALRTGSPAQWRRRVAHSLRAAQYAVNRLQAGEIRAWRNPNPTTHTSGLCKPGRYPYRYRLARSADFRCFGAAFAVRQGCGPVQAQ